jgi:hypothetical protein
LLARMTLQTATIERLKARLVAFDHSSLITQVFWC